MKPLRLVVSFLPMFPLVLLVWTLGLLVPASPALAHRVHLFASVQGNEIVADCRFSKTNPAKNAKVEVFDAQSGKLLASGKSDNQGEARLPVPPELAANPADLLVKLDAGEGHLAEWTIEAEELRDAVVLETGESAPPPAAPAAGEARGGTDAVAPSAPTVPSAENGQCIGPAELAAILREQETRLRAEAAKKRAEELAEQNAQGPGLTEIIGGIGWIVGVFTLIVALKRRRRS